MVIDDDTQPDTQWAGSTTGKVQLQKSPICTNSEPAGASVTPEADDNYIRAVDLSMPKKIEISITMEDIELESLERHADLDVNLIEEDAASGTSPRPQSLLQVPGQDKPQDRSAFCYTPERLVRSQEYRILTPSPTYYLSPCSPNLRETSPFDDRSQRRSPVLRKKLGELIDSSQIGASHLEALLDPGAPEIRVPLSIRRSQRTWPRRSKTAEITEDVLAIANRASPVRCETPDAASSDSSSYEHLNNTANSLEGRRRSLDSTSGIQSIWSGSESGSQTPVCLSHELATASTVPGSQEHNRGVINQVVTILEGLQSDSLQPVDLDCLMEDRFCSTASAHDHVTRLALSIGDDEQPAKQVESTEEAFSQLRGRVEQLQVNSRNMYRDIGLLRVDFQCEERRVNHLQSEATRLHRDVDELRYLDDLLNLLRGELARISRRNWPFVLGHSDYNSEEINLVV